MEPDQGELELATEAWSQIKVSWSWGLRSGTRLKTDQGELELGTKEWNHIKLS